MLKTSTSTTYMNRYGYDEMEKALAAAADEDLRELLAKTSFLGLMVDESVDISIHKNLIIYVKLLVDGEVKIVFGDNVSVTDGRAETILNATVKFMDDFGIEMKQLVGFASDGANVMTGRVSGVATRLKAINPNIVTIHCAAHRLALAAFHGASACEQLLDFQRTVTQVYTYFEYSAVRYERMRQLQEVLNVHVKKFKKPTSVRWLSLEDAVAAIHQSWPVLVAVLENEWEEKKVPEANCLARKVHSYSFLARASMLLDVLDVIGKLSKVFQKDAIDISTMSTMLSSTINTLQNLMQVDGPCFQKTAPLLADLNPSESATRALQSLKTKYITAVINQIRLRLPQDTVSTVNDLNEVLNPKKVPKAAHALNAHGRDSLERLCQRYGTACTVDDKVYPAVINGNRATADFFAFKGFLNASKQKSLVEMCEEIINQDPVMYPDFSKLAEICLVMPLTSVPCERGFSQQNRVKTRLRSRMRVSKLANKMKIKGANELGKDLILGASRHFENARKRIRLDKTK